MSIMGNSFPRELNKLCINVIFGNLIYSLQRFLHNWKFIPVFAVLKNIKYKFIIAKKYPINLDRTNPKIPKEICPNHIAVELFIALIKILFLAISENLFSFDIQLTRTGWVAEINAKKGISNTMFESGGKFNFVLI